MAKESEFGMGLCYCLGLFLAHAERKVDTGEDTSLWFNGAADHLFEMQIPLELPVRLAKRLEKFQSECLSFRLERASKTEKSDAIQEAKDLLRAIDKLHGVPTIKGCWE